jgi:hypothetical protein
MDPKDQSQPAADFSAAQKVWESAQVLYRSPAWSGEPKARHKFGNVRLSSLGTNIDRAQVSLHVGVHSFLSPPAGGFGANFRANLRMSGYQNSTLLSFTEETIAESIAQVRTRGMTGLSLRQAIAEGLRFPFNPHYQINGWRLGAEATVGAGAVGGSLYFGYQLGK